MLEAASLPPEPELSGTAPVLTNAWRWRIRSWLTALEADLAADDVQGAAEAAWELAGLGQREAVPLTIVDELHAYLAAPERLLARLVVAWASQRRSGWPGVRL